MVRRTPYIKRVFPAIVILIALSLLGLMYFQVNWIKDAALVEQTKYRNQVYNAMNDIRNQLRNRGTEINGTNPEYASQDIMAQSVFWDNIAYISPDEVNSFIKLSLGENGINLDFEYGILNNMDYMISRSSKFTTQELHSEAIFNAKLNDSYTLYLFIKEPTSYIWSRLWWMVVASILFAIIIITAFALTVGTIFRQRKISEIKTDFINNMTHEFKTPLATISLAVGAINNNKVQADPEKLKYYADIISDENKRMNKQVETILNAAKMESNELEISQADVEAHNQIEKAAHNISLAVSGRQGRVQLNLAAKSTHIFADEVHFANVINNLLDNAVKYTKGNPVILIETSNPSQDKLQIRIKDNGVGMSRDTISHIFEKFYRAHTGNLHNVKGFGLGLSYVKAVVDAHKAKIKVDSAPSKGSTFILDFPVFRKRS